MMIPAHVSKSYALEKNEPEAASEQLFRRLELFFDSAVNQEANHPDLDVDLAWHHFLSQENEYLLYCKRRYGAQLLHIEDPFSPPPIGKAKCRIDVRE